MSAPAQLRLAVANQKGGTGKTTTAAHLAAVARDTGRRVLIIDGDPQGNTSRYLSGYPDDALRSMPSFGTVAIGEHALADAVLHLGEPRHSTLDDEGRAAWAGIDLLPASSTCAALEAKLNPAEFWAERDALDTAGYDTVIIDCPPNLGSITLLHLYAADRVLIVTSADLWAIEGISKLASTVNKVARSHPDLSIAGVLINLYDRREASQQRCVATVIEQLGDRVLLPPIPERAIVRRAKDYHLPVTVMREPEAREVTALYAGLLERLTTPNAKEATA